MKCIKGSCTKEAMENSNYCRECYPKPKDCLIGMDRWSNEVEKELREEINALKNQMTELKRHVHAYTIFHTEHFANYITGETTAPKQAKH